MSKLYAVFVAAVCVVVGLVFLPTSAHPGEPRAERNIISGVVRDQDGEPISRAFVQIERPPRGSVPVPWEDADAEGRFELTNVPEGTVKIRAVAGHPHLFSTAGTVVESRRGVRNLVIILDAGRELRVRVEDYDRYDHRGLGTTPGAKLVWDQPGTVSTDFRWAPIAKDGSIRFVQLPDEPSFEVWGHASLDRPFKKSGLEPGESVTVIRTVRGLRISGVLLPAKVAVEDDPSLMAYAYQQFRVAGGRINSDGTFVIRGLPEGEYYLDCTLRSQRGGRAFVGKTVRAGATGVELDFRKWER